MMSSNDDEERLLRSVALQNVKSILLARQSAEQDLVRAKEALERKTHELDRSLAMMRATMEAVTDGILVTDGSGAVTGWQPVGTAGEYEIAYVPLVDHFNGQNGCNNGVRIMNSDAQFGVWVWGWGSEDTQTGWVSYGYPAGENVLPINDVIVE